MKTVNKGAELLTVSVKETATNLSATRPSTTVENLHNKAQPSILFFVVFWRGGILFLGWYFLID
jgi:hypothetical protein